MKNPRYRRDQEQLELGRDPQRTEEQLNQERLKKLAERGYTDWEPEIKLDDF